MKFSGLIVKLLLDIVIITQSFSLIRCLTESKKSEISHQ